MKLLLVDDDADQLSLRSLTLAKAGYQISAAHDVLGALRMAEDERPDVAVVDLRLPTQQAGLHLIRSLKVLNSAMRLIVLTGSDTKRFETLPERALVEAVFLKGNASRQLVAYLAVQSSP
jgi:DNA-binding response OmpR family regulator